MSFRSNCQRQAGIVSFGVFHNHLGESHARQIFARTRVHYLHLHALAHHAGDIFQVDVAAGAGVVEAPVLVLLDDHRGHIR